MACRLLSAVQVLHFFLQWLVSAALVFVDTLFGESLYQCISLKFLGLNSIIYCTIGCSKDIASIFPSFKVFEQSRNIYLGSGSRTMWWKLLEVILEVIFLISKIPNIMIWSLQCFSTDPIRLPCMKNLIYEFPNVLSNNLIIRILGK